MKTTRLLQLFLLVVSSAFFSCGSSDDDSGQGQAASLTLSVDNNAINLGDSVTFTVTDSNNANVTNESTIYFSGVAITESTYTPTQPGTFVVNAKLGNATSNNISITVSSLILSANKEIVFPGDIVTFTAIGNSGNDLTSESTFYVNGVEISGNTYTADEKGVDIITATNGTLGSNEATVIVGYSTKVLIEDYTGAWCGWCPRVAYGIELVEEATENAVVAAIHRGSASGSYYDPFNYPAEALEDYINLGGYPMAMLNRTTEWNYPEPNNVSQVVNLSEKPSRAAISLTSELNGTTLNLNTGIDILGDIEGAKLVVYVLEDGLITDQTNYTDYYGGADYLIDFVHENVLRQVPTGLFGEEISASDLDSESNLYVKNLSFELDPSISDAANIHLAVFVTDANGNTLNAVGSQIGENIVIED